MSDYGAIARLLHRLALASPAVAEMQFDIETAMLRGDTEADGEGRHVFVCGLARAGTTVLMRSIHDSGGFASLTYRDMPFVMAPNLWARLQGRRGRKMDPVERAHGDGIAVDFDSPEALEEVFWRVHCGEAYLRTDALTPHEPDAETIAKFRTYVAAILRRYGAERYLSKNNNNILRIGALQAAFPDADILVPFREPHAQAESLRRQHLRFVRMHRNDRFSARYMGWLAHHEFGSDHRPFRFPGAEAGHGDPEGAHYWIDLWTRVYSHLLDAYAQHHRVRFVCYEDLCASSAAWVELRRRIDLEPDVGHGFEDRPGLGAVPDDAATALYERLRTAARAGG